VSVANEMSETAGATRVSRWTRGGGGGGGWIPNGTTRLNDGKPLIAISTQQRLGGAFGSKRGETVRKGARTRIVSHFCYVIRAISWTLDGVGLA